MGILWFIWQPYIEHNLIFLVLKPYKRKEKKANKKIILWVYSVLHIITDFWQWEDLKSPEEIGRITFLHSLKPLLVLWPSHHLWKTRYFPKQLRDTCSAHSPLHTALPTQPLHQGSIRERRLEKVGVRAGGREGKVEPRNNERQREIFIL